MNEAGRRELIGRIEGLIHEDVGRKIAALFDHARGGLWGAAGSLASTPGVSVGIVTGFYVPGGKPPAAETDGPPASALLARGLIGCGVPCQIVTDEPCRGACAAALEAAGLDRTVLHVAQGGFREAWLERGVTHAIAIERCGRCVDGRPRNMRGHDISAFTAAFDDDFTGGPWTTIAAADGGNEIGMGSLACELIRQHIAYGERIACVTPADHLILAGVSHWGAYALLASLAVLRPDWAERLLACLDEALDRRIIEATVREGPAVDGVSLARAVTIDNLGLEMHHRKLKEIRSLVDLRP